MARTGKTIHPANPYLFLVSQSLFLIAFQFLGIPSVYLLIALALGVLFFVKDYRSLDNHQRNNLGLMVTSLTMFTLFLSISPLYLESGSWLRNGLLSFGFSATYFLGFLLVKKYHITFEVIIKSLLLGLSLFVLVNVVYTLYRYLPFYRWIFAGHVIYVNGEVYVVSEEVKWLIGLQFKEVNVSYMSFYLTLLLAPWLSQIHTLNTFRFKDWRHHGWWLLPTLVGLIGVIFLPVFVPLFISLTLGLLIWIFPTLKMFVKTYPKLIKLITYGFFVFISLMVVLFFIDAYDVLVLGTLMKQWSPLQRILDFPRIEAYQSVLRSVINYPFGGFAPILVQGRYLTTTSSFFFDTLHQGGIFALFGLIMIAVFFSNQLIHFGRQETVSLSMRMTLIGLVSLFVLYQTFQTHLYPFVREDMRLVARLMLDEPLWMMMIFLMGTIMIDPFTGILKRK
jgi:hypothetical protein